MFFERAGFIARRFIRAPDFFDSRTGFPGPFQTMKHFFASDDVRKNTQKHTYKYVFSSQKNTATISKTNT